MNEEEVDYDEDEGDTAAEASASTTMASVTSAEEAVPVERQVFRERIGIKTKGRGYDIEGDRYEGRGGIFETIDRGSGSGPCQSIEGWVVFITNVHPEASEDAILDACGEYGAVKSISMNLDRQTGAVKV